MHGIKSTKLNTLPSMLQAVIIRLIELLKKGLFFKANPFFCRPIKSMFGEKIWEGEEEYFMNKLHKFTHLLLVHWCMPPSLVSASAAVNNNKNPTCWQVVTVVTGAARNIVAITGVTWLKSERWLLRTDFFPKLLGCYTDVYHPISFEAQLYKSHWIMVQRIMALCELVFFSHPIWWDTRTHTHAFRR